MVKGGDLGEIRPGVLPKPLEDAIAGLKPGEISKPIRTEYGYHVVKLTALKQATQKTFEEMKLQLSKQARQRKAEERYYEASEKFRNLVYEQPDSLAPAADTLGLKVETTDWFDRNGGRGVAASPRVVEAAFSAEVLTQKRNSDAIEVSGDTLMAVHLAEHRPSTLKPLAEVRPQIERALRQEAAQNAARELGESLVKELSAGQSLEAVAKKRGLKYVAPRMIQRDQAQAFDRRVIEEAFRAPRPESGKSIFGGVDMGVQGYAIYAVSKVKEGDPGTADTATKERARTFLGARRGSDYFGNYRARLKQKADVKIYQEKL